MERVPESERVLLEQACGVLAARLEIDPELACQILARVARRERVSEAELAAAVVSSCTDSAAVLPRDLYAAGYDHAA